MQAVGRKMLMVHCAPHRLPTCRKQTRTCTGSIEPSQEFRACHRLLHFWTTTKGDANFIKDLHPGRTLWLPLPTTIKRPFPDHAHTAVLVHSSILRGSLGLWPLLWSRSWSGTFKFVPSEKYIAALETAIEDYCHTLGVPCRDSFSWHDGE